MSIGKKNETPDIPEEAETSEKFDPERRAFLAKSGRFALGLLSILIADDLVTKEARADDYDMPRDEIRRQLATEELDENGEIISEQLSEKEIVLMEKSMDALYKHYLQPTFLLYAAPVCESKNVEKAMELAIRYNDELYYDDDGSGTIILKKRPVNSSHIPDGFKIKIRDGIITQINVQDKEYEINTDALENSEKEWQEVQDKIEDINQRIINFEVDKTEQDWKWFEFYSLRLPYKFRKLLQLKAETGCVNAHELQILRKLNRLLRRHPKNIKEMREGGKRPGFYTTRRPKGSPSPTPMNMVELVYAAGSPRQYQTFATFSFDGFAMQNTTPRKRKATWEESSLSFAEAYSRKINKPLRECMPNKFKEFESHCQKIGKPANQCQQSKLRKWLVQAK